MEDTNTALATREAETARKTGQRREQWGRPEIELLKKTVAKGTTDEELAMFAHICGKYGLDPFVKEIWCIKRVKKVKRNGDWDYPRLPNGDIDYSDADLIIMTSRDGYLKIAERDFKGIYQGMMSDVVYQKDSFRKLTKEPWVEHEYHLQDRGAPVGAYCLVFRTDRIVPIFFFAPIDEFDTGNGTWKNFKHSMILARAEAGALKRAFSLSGMTTDAEIGDLQDDVAAIEIHMDEASMIESPNPGTDNAVDAFNHRKTDISAAYKKVFDGDNKKAVGAIKDVIGPKKPKDWTADDVEKLEAELAEIQKMKGHDEQAGNDATFPETLPFDNGSRSDVNGY